VCGIAGELRSNAAPDRDALARMGTALAPRGPDGAGEWVDGSVGLTHRRLAIIDLTERGAQPMVDEDLGLTVVFNGCIYNHRELRAELERDGFAFQSHSDTEVLLKGWAAWGEGMLDRLAGMFAFCLVEHASGRRVLARDRLGIKPLYLCDTPDGGLRFASTLPALLAAGSVDTGVDPVALHHYLSFHSIVPAPRTILRGVRKLAPATLLVIEPGGCRRERRYWDPPFERDPAREDWTPEEWERAVLDALRVAVRRRMVADVPVGILLSGGLDSSLIVALLAEEGQRGLATFAVGFPDVGDRVGDEFVYSDLIAREFGTDHHQIRVGPERLLPALPRAIAAMSEPMVSHDAVAFSCSPRRSPTTARSCSRGKAQTRCSRATTGTRHCSRPTGTDSTSTQARSSTATTRACAQSWPNGSRLRTARRTRSRRAGSGPPARRRRSTAACASTPR
jgi:asparagine synthase (glutamine-hydrolysing)